MQILVLFRCSAQIRSFRLIFFIGYGNFQDIIRSFHFQALCSSECTRICLYSGNFSIFIYLIKVKLMERLEDLS